MDFRENKLINLLILTLGQEHVLGFFCLID